MSGRLCVKLDRYGISLETTGMTDANYLDAYCERAGDPGFWAEPVNAVTNLAFIAAGVWIWQIYRSGGVSLRRTWDIAILIALIFATGLGSAAWHTVATRWALLADVIPITLFMHFYLGVFLVRIMGLGWPMAMAGVAVFFGAGIGFGQVFPPGTLNGTIMYVPAYLTMLLMAGILSRRRIPGARILWTVAGVWTASLFFRTVDEAWCDWFPMGTHFLWHCLNAIVLALLVRLLVRHGMGHSGR